MGADGKDLTHGQAPLRVDLIVYKVPIKGKKCINVYKTLPDFNLVEWTRSTDFPQGYQDSSIGKRIIFPKILLGQLDVSCGREFSSFSLS